MLTRLQKKNIEQKKNTEYTEHNFDIVDVNHVIKTHFPKDINKSALLSLNIASILLREFSLSLSSLSKKIIYLPFAFLIP